MGWWYTAIAGVFVLGVLLAFPVAIGVCATLGGILMTVDRLTTRCPGCDQRQMRQTNGICETYPTGRGTGRFYLCRSCGGRWFWSNDDRGWVDASSPDLAWAFVDAHDGQA
jgi:hypothetical protein